MYWFSPFVSFSRSSNIMRKYPFPIEINKTSCNRTKVVCVESAPFKYDCIKMQICLHMCLCVLYGVRRKFSHWIRHLRLRIYLPMCCAEYLKKSAVCVCVFAHSKRSAITVPYLPYLISPHLPYDVKSLSSFALAVCVVAIRKCIASIAHLHIAHNWLVIFCAVLIQLVFFSLLILHAHPQSLP